MDKLQSLLDRIEGVVTYLESRAPSEMHAPSSNDHASSKQVLIEFDRLINGSVKEFNDISSKIGGDVQEHSKLLLSCFNSQRQFLEHTLHQSKPNDKQLEQMMKPCFDLISACEDFRNQKRTSAYFNHLSAISDSIMALKWIAVPSDTVPFVQSMQEAAEFFTNRVIKEYKDSKPEHVAWAKALISVWSHVGTFVKQHYPAGLTWGDQAANNEPSRVPPPPPPRPFKPENSPFKSSEGAPAATAALFSELNRGSAVTAGLRKVTDDMKTHKNPKLREAPALEPHASSKHDLKPEVNVKQPSAQKKAPLLELQGNKWVVENFTNEDLRISETKPKHTVYIFNCVGCKVEIKGKVNSISLDRCTKTGVVFDDLIGALDVVNCQNVQVQTLGQLQTVSVDKTDSCQIYLSKISLNADVITSKSSTLNVLIPQADGDFEEYPVPEHFKTTYTGKGLTTVPLTGI